MKHRWGDPVRTEYETRRLCLRGCGCEKVTHHQETIWTDYWRAGVKLGDHAPKCEVIE